MSLYTQKRSGVSVIVCCYNSQELLPETIKHLALQEVPDSIKWEVIIINNASSDDTTGTSYHEWDKYNSKASFNVVDQPIPGLSNARKKGIETAQYEYLIFCDDDNWFQKNYISNAFEIMQSNKKIGALGGVGSPVYQTEPPEWFDKDKMQIMLALGEQGDSNGDISESKGYVYGAGMVLRCTALNHIKKAGFEPKLMGRFKNQLSSGEDDEICYALRMAGYSVWFDNSLEFKHFIPTGRLKWEYFLKLNEMNSKSGIYLLPYKERLRGEGEKKWGNKLRWITEVPKSVLAIGSMWKFYRRYLFYGEHHLRAHIRYRRLIGEMKGWLSLRSRYSEIIDHLINFENKLQSVNQKPIDYSKKTSVHN